MFGVLMRARTGGRPLVLDVDARRTRGNITRAQPLRKRLRFEVMRFAV